MALSCYRAIGDAGDIVMECTALSQMGKVELILSPHKLTRQRMSVELANNIIPLLRLQPYISAVSYCDSVRGIDLWEWRKSYSPGFIGDRCCRALGLPPLKAGSTWLTVDKVNRINKVVVNLTSRYRVSGIDYGLILDHYGRSNVVFVGLRDEHSAFERDYGSVDYYNCNNLLEAARVIAGSDLFIGNQSSCYHIASGLGVNRLLERNKGCDNSYVDGGYFYEMPAIEDL